MSVELVGIHGCSCDNCGHFFKWWPGDALDCPVCHSVSVTVLWSRRVPVES